MFLVLVNNNEIFRFWGNKPGDIFLDSVIQLFKLDTNSLKVIYFPTLIQKPEDCEFKDNKLLVKIKSQVVDESAPKQDAEGNPLPVITKDVFSDGPTYEGEVYFENGLMLKPC